MADDKEVIPKPESVLKEGEVAVPKNLLQQMQEDMANMQIKQAEAEAKIAGLKAVDDSEEKDGTPKLRERRTFEPAFRTVRLRKFPIAGDHENMGIVVGFTNRGAYQTVDRTGVSPQVVDKIDVVFLDHEKNSEGKLIAESIPLNALINSPELRCKIVKINREEKKVGTGEEINVSVFDPQHGLVSTGEIIDGFTTHSEITYTIAIPGRAETYEIDQQYVNL